MRKFNAVGAEVVGAALLIAVLMYGTVKLADWNNVRAVAAACRPAAFKWDNYDSGEQYEEVLAWCRRNMAKNGLSFSL